MKKLLTLTILLTGLTVSAQQPKQDSLIMRIEMDSTTWKNVVNLIKENFNGNTTTGRLLLETILIPFYQYKFVPREALEPKKLSKKE